MHYEINFFLIFDCGINFEGEKNTEAFIFISVNQLYRITHSYFANFTVFVYNRLFVRDYVC